MTSSSLQRPMQDPDRSGRFAATLFGALFVVLGILMIAWLGMAIARAEGIRMALGMMPAPDGETPSVIMAFLTEFGIVLPLLTLGLGGLSIALGFWLHTQNIVAARWASVVLGWLIVGLLVVAGFNLVRIIAASISERAVQLDPAFLTPMVASLGAALLCYGAYRWLTQHMESAFYGLEGLGSRETRLAWTLLIPTLAVFVLVAARPLEQTFIRSLTDKRFASAEIPSFVGLQNYQELLSLRLDIVPCRLDEETGACDVGRDGSIRWQSIDRTYLEEGFRTVWNLPLPTGDPPRSLAISGLDAEFIQSIWTTVLFAVVSVSLELVIAFFIALTVNSSFRGRGMMRAVMLIPWAIPTVVAARLWELMLKDTSAGIVNRILMDLRIIDAPLAWLSDVSLQLATAITVDAWKTAPFVALLLLAGLQSIPSDLYEAADVDGASKFRQFWAITLPLLRPTIAVALVFRTLDALRVFDLFNVLFGRQQLSMATFNYETLVNNQQDGYASAVSILLFLIISIFAIIYVRALNVEAD